MSAPMRLFFSLTVFVLAASGGIADDVPIELDIDDAVAAVLDSPDARQILETECLATLVSEAEWSDLYRAARILAVIGSSESVAPVAALLSDSGSSHLARIVLEGMPYPEAGDALRAALLETDGPARLGIMASIAMRQDAKAVPDLASLLADEDAETASTAMMALGRIGTTEAVEALKSSLTHKDMALRLTAAEATLAAAGQLTRAGNSDVAAALCKSFLLEGDWPGHVRAGAFNTLLDAETKEAPDHILSAITGEDVLLRSTAIAAVPMVDGAGVTARFTAALPALVPEIQAPMLEALSLRTDPPAVEVLYGAMESDNEQVRLAAYKALAAHGNEDAIVPLVGRLAERGERQEQQAIIETLRRLRGADIDVALITALRAAPPAARPGLIEALVQRNATNALDAIVEQAQNDDARPAAFRALGQLAAPDDLPMLLSLLAELDGDTGRVEAEAAVVALCQRAADTKESLVITKALYGNLPDGDFADVTERIAKKVENGSLSVVASNNEFGDPAPNTVKKLRVEYVVDGKAASMTVNENETLVLSAETVPLAVVEALGNALDAAQRPAAQVSLLRVLGRLGGVAAFERLLPYLAADRPEAVRDGAIRILAAWPDVHAVETLVQLYGDTDNTTHRGLALRGSVRLLRLGELSVDDTVSAYERLLSASNRAEEFKMLLAGLADVVAPGALRLARACLNNAEVSAEAALAVERIRAALGDAAPEETPPPVPEAPPAMPVPAGYELIFNGENLDGWAGDPRLWRVEDGSIIGEATEENPVEVNTFLIWEGGEAGDFDLKFRYRIESDWANSGIQIRSKRLDNLRVHGYQPDIASEDWITGICYEEGGRGILARRGQKLVIGADNEKEVTQFADEKALGDYIQARDWNEYHIIAKGNRFYSRINGHTMHEIIDDSPEAVRSGVIAFQLHVGPPMKIRFSDIMLKRNEPAAAH